MISGYFEVNEALQLFEVNFEHILRITCALSLAALESELISLVINSLDWQHFKFDNNKIEFNFELWGRHLKQKHKLDEKRSQLILDSFANWFEVAIKTELEVIRWLCHGHIGEAGIWSAYGACIHEICTRVSVPEPDKKVRSIAKRDRFTAFVASLIQKYLLIEDPKGTPLECFALLGIQLV
jgi:hypothetical protein